MTDRDPFDTIREALEALRHERVTRSPIAPTGDVSDALAALDEIREQLRQADELRAWVDAGPTMRLRTIEQVAAAQARADRAEQENQQLRDMLERIVSHEVYTSSGETRPIRSQSLEGEGMRAIARAALAAAEENAVRTEARQRD